MLPPAKLNKVLDSNGGSYYFFSDDDLEISLQIGPGRMFRWKFKNIGRKTLVIDPHSIVLLREKDQQEYALWGEPNKSLPKGGPIELKAGGFATYEYPVRSKSPFWPFAPKQEDTYQLKLTVRWGYRNYAYTFGFEPLPEYREQDTKN